MTTEHTEAYTEMKQFSADPDAMNERRSAWACLSLAAYVAATGVDWEDALGDLLADLMHWSDRNGYDFDLTLDRARGHHGAETQAA